MRERLVLLAVACLPWGADAVQTDGSAFTWGLFGNSVSELLKDEDSDEAPIDPSELLKSPHDHESWVNLRKQGFLPAKGEQRKSHATERFMTAVNGAAINAPTPTKPEVAAKRVSAAQTAQAGYMMPPPADGGDDKSSISQLTADLADTANEIETGPEEVNRQVAMTEVKRKRRAIWASQIGGDNDKDPGAVAVPIPNEVELPKDDTSGGTVPLTDEKPEQTMPTLSPLDTIDPDSLTLESPQAIVDVAEAKLANADADATDTFVDGLTAQTKGLATQSNDAASGAIEDVFDHLVTDLMRF